MSGRVSRRRPDGPEDANPLNRRIPAEVVSRRRRTPAAGEGEDDVSLDRKSVFALKPPQRAKWLAKALKGVADSVLRASDVYDLVANSRFVEDVPYKLGKNMARTVQQQLTLFSAKQQRFLVTEAALGQKFGMTPEEEKELEVSVDVKANDGTADDSMQMEDMMARCRAFVREKNMIGGDVVAEDAPATATDLGDSAPPVIDASAACVTAESTDGANGAMDSAEVAAADAAARAVTAVVSKRKKSGSSSSSSSSEQKRGRSAKKRRSSSSSSSSAPRRKRAAAKKKASSSSSSGSRKRRRCTSSSSSPVAKKKGAEKKARKKGGTKNDKVQTKKNKEPPRAKKQKKIYILERVFRQKKKKNEV